MRLTLAILIPVLVCVAGSAIAAPSDADAIEHALRASSSVSFYFVSRTENYNYDAKTLQSEASIVVRRSCGANCHSFMGPVLANLRASKSSNCVTGQQDLLVTFGETQLVYSHSGRQVMYQGRCYFNAHGILSLLENNGFFFR